MSAEWNNLMLAVDGVDSQMPPDLFFRGSDEEKQEWYRQKGLLRRKEQKAQRAQE